MTSWSARIEHTDNAMDLLSLAREFLGSWEPSDLALIPADARPQRVKGIDDLSHWHRQLVDCYCAGALRDVEAARVRDMLQFFSFAVQRSIELEGMPIDGHEAAARLFSDRSVPKLFTSAMSGVREH